MDNNERPTHESVIASPTSGRTCRTIPSAELLQGRLEVCIAHGTETYRLRLTRSGKLILQK